MRELPEGRRLQGARRLQRRLRPLRRHAGEGRRHPFLRQPRPLAQLRRRPARHPLSRRHAAHGAPGQEGRGARLRRHHHRMRALDHQPRGGLRRGPGRDRRRFRPSLQRPARHRGPGDVLARTQRTGRRARGGHRAHRRRRHDLGHLSHDVQHRAWTSRSSRPSPNRPTTPIAASRPATSSPTTRRTRSPTA